VKAQETLINAVLEDTFWINADIPTLNETRLALRNLIQYIEFEKQKNLYTNIEDTLADIEEVNLLNQYQELGAYQKRVEKFIRQNRNHITIHRIINNQPITKNEVEELERLLFSIYKNGNKELLEKATDGKPLGKFIRSILGLDVNAAKEAFGNFVRNANLNPAQIHFINTIIDYLAVNGTIERNMLFDKPFTDINDQGLAGVFNIEEAGAIVSIVDGINRNAVQVM
jgi:type I restriction enzyme R subunit